MATPFIGQIKAVGFNFEPRGYADCDGTLLAIAQNTALFSILGTIYGGDGRTTFGLPDLRGRLPMHDGQGPGLTDRRLGERGGQETVTLTSTQIPSHNHALGTVSGLANEGGVAGNTLASVQGSSTRVGSSGAPNATMRDSISNTGSNAAHNNMMPYLVVKFVIALEGVYPSRS
jgi:microcystin-dependent protein